MCHSPYECYHSSSDCRVNGFARETDDGRPGVSLTRHGGKQRTQEGCGNIRGEIYKDLVSPSPGMVANDGSKKGSMTFFEKG